MTCIIGLEDRGRIWMGCDSAAAASWDIRVSKVNKIFRLGDLAVGFTSSWRMGQILRYQVKIDPQEKETDESYMVTKVVESIREAFKAHGYSKIEDNQESGGTLLVGCKGKIYTIYSDYQVNRFDEGYSAIGCGSGYALGAMRSLEGLPPKKRIRKALEISAHFSNGVTEPFRIEKY